MLPKTKSRVILIAMLAMCIAPIVLAQWLWSRGQVQGGQSYGQLLAQPALNRDAQWRLVAHDPAGCTASRQVVGRAELGDCPPEARRVQEGV